MTSRSRSTPRPAVRDYRKPQSGTSEAPGPFSFVLEGSPIPKGRPRVTKSGHVYTEKATKEAEQSIELLARVSGAQVHHGPVEVRLSFWHDGTRARDWDNLAKTVCDALNGVCWVDDSQIRRAMVTVDVDAERPRTEVEVRAFSSSPVVERVMDEAQLQKAFRRWVDEMDDDSGRGT